MSVPVMGSPGGPLEVVLPAKHNRREREMLVLARKYLEGVRITVGGETVIVRIVQPIHGNRAKLGFEAPRNVQIVRDELYESLEPVPA